MIVIHVNFMSGPIKGNTSRATLLQKIAKQLFVGKRSFLAIPVKTGPRCTGTVPRGRE